jgi:hypothetical protein
MRRIAASIAASLLRRPSGISRRNHDAEQHEDEHPKHHLQLARSWRWRSRSQAAKRTLEARTTARV